MHAESYTFWGLIGTNFTDMLLLKPFYSHGLFSIVGLIASAAPFAAPFIPTAWARYLNAAPLAYVLTAWVAIYINEHRAFGVIAIEEEVNPFSLHWGIFDVRRHRPRRVRLEEAGGDRAREIRGAASLAARAAR